MNSPPYKNRKLNFFISRLFFLLILFVCLINEIITAQPAVILNDSTFKYSINSSLLIFEDTSGILSFDSVKKMKSEFNPSGKLVPNPGFTNSVFWLKFNINDLSTKPGEWVLDIAMPSLHQVDFYITLQDKLIEYSKSGFNFGKKVKNTPFRNPSIEFMGMPGKTITVYTRIKSETPIILPVFLREKNKYIEYDRFREFFLGLYFGALLVMVLYHFYLFLSTSDKDYLWLVMFTICFGLGQMTAVYGYLSDWNCSFPGRYLKYLHVINYLAAFFAIVLSRSMTLSKKYVPNCDRILRILMVITLIFVPISLFMNFMLAERLLILFNISPMPFLLYAGFISYRKGHRPALFYLFAAIVLITGLAIYNLMYGFNLFPFHEFTYFIPNISFVITLTLFSIGLADKINSLKCEQEKAQKKAISDLNEKYQLQKEISMIERELHQSRKMETVGRLLSGIAHDIKNLLNPIIGYSLLIRKECKSADKLANKADQLVKATNSLKDLTTTLVNVSRTKAVGASSININHAIMQIGSLIKHSCPLNITIEFKLTDKQPVIIADAGMLQSAIMNLGINAIDAMQKDGVLSISTDYADLNESNTIRKKFECPAGQYVAISFSDTGMGMNQEVIDHLFEPFFTTKTNGKGTGLGLASVYNCIKLHNGCINVDSTNGKGTTITLYFPVQTKLIQDSIIFPRETTF